MLRLATPGLKSQRLYEQRKQVLDYAMHMRGPRFRAEIWMLRVAKGLAKPLPNSSSAVLRTKLGIHFPTARPQW